MDFKNQSNSLLPIEIFDPDPFHCVILTGETYSAPDQPTLTRCNVTFLSKGIEMWVGQVDESPTVGVEPAKEGAASTMPSVPNPRTAEKYTCIVDGSNAFVLKVSSFFGLSPLRFESQSTGCSITLSARMCIYSYILVTILICWAIYGVAAEINTGTERSVRMSSLMSQAVATCDVLVVAATAGAGVYGAPGRMRKMMMYIDIIASVDKGIGAQSSRISMNERKTRVVTFTALLIFMGLIIDDNSLYARQAAKYNRVWSVALNNLGNTFLWFVVVVLEMQFAFTALYVRSRLKAINDVLAQTTKQLASPLDKRSEIQQMNIIRVAPNVSLLVDSLAAPDNAAIFTKQEGGEPRLTVPPSEAVRRVASLHEAICEAIYHVNSSYGLPLIVILVSTLLHLIVTPYFLIIELGQFSSTDQIHFLVLRLVWCAFHFTRLLLAVEPCHYTTTEGKRTEELVSRLMTHAPPTGILPSRLESFTRQLALRSVNYTPMGMCTLDRPLMSTIIGAVTTYLVILLQFQSVAV